MGIFILWYRYVTQEFSNFWIAGVLFNFRPVVAGEGELWGAAFPAKVPNKKIPNDKNMPIDKNENWRFLVRAKFRLLKTQCRHASLVHNEDSF